MTASTALAMREDRSLATALDARMPALTDMLPGGEEGAKRFKRVVIQAIVKNPDLMACTPQSLIAAVMEAATIGFEPTGTLGGAHLVPYKGEAKLIIGYGGFIALARRSGAIDTIEARVVRREDMFSFEYGTNAHVSHTPNQDAQDAPITHVYAVAKLRGGGVQFDVMTFDEVEAIRKASPLGSRGPWKDHFPEMARKTVVRRLVKYLPLAEAARDIIGRDDEREFPRDAVVSRVSAEERAGSVRQRIASRTAALRGRALETEESEASDPRAGGAKPTESVQGDSVGGSSTCPHPQEAAVVDERGVVCGQCGELVAERPEPKPRSRRKAKEPLQPGEEGYGNARAHAVAAERGLDHAAVHRIAADVLSIDEGDLAKFSVKDLSEADWEPVIAAISEAPVADDEAETFAGRMALQAGMGSGDDPWSEAEPAAVEMFATDLNAITAAQWREFGIRTAARNPLP